MTKLDLSSTAPIGAPTRDQIERPDWLPVAQWPFHVDLPVFTVFGEKNDPCGFADRWQAMFPQAQSWTVPDGNHFPMCDDPDGGTSRLRDWHRPEVAS